MRARGLLSILVLGALTAMASSPSRGFALDRGAQSQAESSPANAQVTAMESYEGLTVERVTLPDVPQADEAQLISLITLKPGEPLTRDRVRDTVQTLFATGRFADIRVEAEHSGERVIVSIHTAPNYFIGEVTASGAPARPNQNQIVNQSKLQLGELLTQEKVDRAIKNIQQLLQENGYYQGVVTSSRDPHPATQQIDIHFDIQPGERARVGQVSITGNPIYTQPQVLDIAKLHPGDIVSAQKLTSALDRLRKKYQKQNRLLTQVAITQRMYRQQGNAVDYTLSIDPGPKVEISAEGFKIRRSVLKRNVPVFEENALDDDLLNEGRRNLLNYLQSRGYFGATVGLIKRNISSDELRVIYTIDEGDRHKLAKVLITGSISDNRGFPVEDLLSRMQVQPAGKLLSHGRYSQALLANDIRGFEDLYKANGFQQVKIISSVQDDYKGEKNQIAVSIKVDPGPLTLVHALQVTGNEKVSEDVFALNIVPGQPFSESRVADDRDIILNYYFNHGFPDATFEATAKPAPGETNQMDVSFNIHEGRQVFVDKVLVTGLDHTRPFVVQREILMKPGDPLSQISLLKTQQSLYDLGIFSQVDTAVQNPDGSDAQKDVLVNVQEAKRYTFNYGLGLEFQTGQPAVGSNQPQGETGVSPRVSLDITRLNFRGRNHTITFKAHAGRLQQRALVSYNAPAWFNSKNWRLSITTFYDNTLDVTTFTSERLEGSIQAEQTISKASTMFYRLVYRRVRASNIEVSQDQIPLLSQPTRVGAPGFSYIRDKRDNPIETTKGNYTTIDGSVASGYFGSEADFSRGLIQNTTYHAFGKNRPGARKFVFARSTRIGVENPYGDTIVLFPGQPVPTGKSLIPLPERFFSGGGNSHRGFSLNQAGPRDPTSGFPLGGSALFLNNLELRFPPLTLPFFQDNLSFAVFHDAGNVFTTGHDMLHNLLRWKQKNPQLCEQQSTADQCDYNYISHAIGVGVRYKTPIGPVRFDFGYNLNPPRFPSIQNSVFVPQQVRHFNVFFSIGQTF